MDLRSWLSAKAEIRLLLVPSPGGTAVRLAVECAVRQRGWRAAASAADANMIIVAGPRIASVQPYVRQLWATVPAPRIRVEIQAPADVAETLDAAATRVRSDGGRLENATPAEPEVVEPPEHDHAHDHHGSAETPAHEHRGNDHGHDMSSMAMPGGIAMADRAEDRDGLKLDVLTVPLGPATPDWPTGLLVRTTVQGDVIAQAEVSTLTSEQPTDAFWSRPWSRATAGETVTLAEAYRWRIARRLDSSATLLSVAGWDDASITARRLRDDLLSTPPSAGTVRQLRRWTARMARSRMLRWTLAGMGATAPGSSAPSRLAGDAFDRLAATLDEVSNVLESLGDEGPLAVDDFPADPATDTEWVLAMLPDLLAGTEFAQARLIVASFDPDIELLDVEPVDHG